MNEDIVGRCSQPALAICEISYPPLEGDIHRVFHLHLHVERNSGAFHGLKHCLINSCLWIPLLLTAWLNSGSIGLVMYLHVLAWPACRRHVRWMYWRVLKTSDRGRICSALLSQQFKWGTSSCPEQAVPNRLRPLRLAICRASSPPATSLRSLLAVPRGDKSVLLTRRRVIFHPLHVATPTGNQESSQCMYLSSEFVSQLLRSV